MHCSTASKDRAWAAPVKRVPASVVHIPVLSCDTVYRWLRCHVYTDHVYADHVYAHLCRLRYAHADRAPTGRVDVTWVMHAQIADLNALPNSFELFRPCMAHSVLPYPSYLALYSVDP